jgi:acetyl esterase
VALKPEIRAYLDASAGALDFPAEALVDEAVADEYLRRARAPRTLPVPEPVGAVSDVETPAGPRLRVYRPGGHGTSMPIVLFFHGGGWVLGSLDSNDAICRRLCNITPAVVVSIDYRLAPEHPFPAALADADAARRWVDEHIERYGADPRRLVLFGTSAGGNLAAASAIRWRDSRHRAAMLQVLGYPVTDSSMSYPSYRDNGDGYVLRTEQMRWFWRQYVPDESQRGDPLAAPLRARSLAGLPPAVILTAEFDPLRDEGELFANRLAKDGVPVELLQYRGQVHGFLAMLGLTDDADQAIEHIAMRIRESAP